LPERYINPAAEEQRVLRQATKAKELILNVLGDATLGIYLYGSCVSGGLRPHSDLDLLVICERSLSCAERLDVLRGLLPLSAGSGAQGCDRRPLELSVLARSSLVPWRYPPQIELQFGEWMRTELIRGHVPKWPHEDPDVTILVASAFSASIALLGPSISAILNPVPREDLQRALAATVPILMPGIEEGDDRRNGLLTLARIWMTLTTGEIRPKDEAAEWALAQLPEELRGVLKHARSAYLGETPEDWDGLECQIRPYVDYVSERIEGLPG
jgi:streptomycin 3"-adenylyltransferase